MLGVSVGVGVGEVLLLLYAIAVALLMATKAEMLRVVQTLFRPDN